MFLVTKWWFALPVDGPDKIYWGFPFAFMGEGFHTSMSFQFFLTEFILDFGVYLSFWLVLFFLVSLCVHKINIPKITVKIVWFLSLILIAIFSMMLSFSNPVFKAKRDYNWHLMKTGTVFLWQTTPRPDITQFHPAINLDSLNIQP